MGREDRVRAFDSMLEFDIYAYVAPLLTHSAKWDMECVIRPIRSLDRPNRTLVGRIA